MPSAVLPHAYNYLFNPAHPQAGAALIAVFQQVPYEQRILELPNST